MNNLKEIAAEAEKLALADLHNLIERQDDPTTFFMKIMSVAVMLEEAGYADVAKFLTFGSGVAFRTLAVKHDNVPFENN